MPLFRLYHVLFAAGALAAYFSAEELGLVHAWIGYGIATLIGLRLLLGLARKRGFEFRRLVPLPGPAPLGQTGIRHPAIGHALTLALLGCIAGSAATGIAMDRGGTLVGQSIRNDDESDERGKEDEGLSLGLIAPAYADDDEGTRGGGEDEEDGPLGELHEALGSLMLALVALHAAWLLIFRLNLARYMLFMPARARVRA